MSRMSEKPKSVADLPAYVQPEWLASLQQEGTMSIENGIEAVKKQKLPTEIAEERASRRMKQDVAQEQERKDRELFEEWQQIAEVARPFESLAPNVLERLRTEIAQQIEGGLRRPERVTSALASLNKTIELIKMARQRTEAVAKAYEKTKQEEMRQYLQARGLERPSDIPDQVQRVLLPFADYFHDQAYVQPMNGMGVWREVLSPEGGFDARYQERTRLALEETMSQGQSLEAGSKTWPETIRYLSELPGRHQVLLQEIFRAEAAYAKNGSWDDRRDALVATVGLLALGDPRIPRGTVPGSLTRDELSLWADRARDALQVVEQLVTKYGWTDEVASAFKIKTNVRDEQGNVVRTAVIDDALIQVNRDRKRQEEFAAMPEKKLGEWLYREMSLTDEKKKEYANAGDVFTDEAERVWTYAGLTAPGWALFTSPEGKPRLAPLSDVLEWKKKKKPVAGKPLPQRADENPSITPPGNESENSFVVFQAIHEREFHRLREFFGQDFNNHSILTIPAGITPELVRFWEQNHFRLEYWPAMQMNEELELPGWEHKPGKRYTPGAQYGIEFFDEVEAIQNLSDNQENPNLQGLTPLDLPGAWVLKDTRPKPNYQNGSQTYAHDELIQGVIKDLVRQGVVNQEASQGHRNKIHPDVFKKPEFWEAIGANLGVDRIPGAMVRLPRTIESNVMGQGPGFNDTSTYEWNEEYYGSGRRVVSGGSDRGGASVVSWGGRAVVSVGFRPLVVFPPKKQQNV